MSSISSSSSSCSSCGAIAVGALGGAEAVNANSCGTRERRCAKIMSTFFVAVSQEADDAADEDGRSLLRTKQPLCHLPLVDQAQQFPVVYCQERGKIGSCNGGRLIDARIQIRTLIRIKDKACLRYMYVHLRPCPMPHAPCPMPHAPCPMLHTCTMLPYRA